MSEIILTVSARTFFVRWSSWESSNEDSEVARGKSINKDEITSSYDVVDQIEEDKSRDDVPQADNVSSDAEAM